MRGGETILGRYRVARTLHEDADGSLRIATDADTRVRVLVEKLMVGHDHALRGAAERLATLSHALLPKVLDIETAPDSVTLVLELRDGPTFSQTRTPARNEAESLGTALSCLPLIDYLHQLKPPFHGLSLDPDNLLQRGTRFVLRSFRLKAGQSEIKTLGQTLHLLLTGDGASPPDMSADTRTLLDGLLAASPEALALLRSKAQAKPGAWLSSDPRLLRAPAQDPAVVLCGRYRQEKVLGQGGMGAVYLAMDMVHRRQVALKEMRIPAGDPETRAAGLRQFGIEASMLNRLCHPSLPRIHDFFVEGGRPYLVMDYIPGVTLEEAPPASADMLLRWAGELCDVLEYLHSQVPPVIFQDLKPANIMVDTEGRLRLIDFGIANLFGSSDTSEGGTSGSHGYSAPEQYGSGAVDERVDIYALGAVLYFLLVRSAPPGSLDLMIANAEMLSTRQARPDVPERVHAAVDCMMSLERDVRPVSAQQCREILGLSESLVPVNATDPVRLRHLLKEEFDHLFPAPWGVRQAFLTTIAEHVRGQDRRKVILLWGEAGTGKTRLLDELEATTRGDMLGLPRFRGRRPVGRRSASPLAAWTRTLTGPSPDVDPLQLIAYWSRTSGRRLHLMLDDAHWLDGTSLRAIDAVLALDLPHGLTLVVSVQSGSPASDLSESLQRWTLQCPVSEVFLPAFTLDEMRAYLASALPPIGDLEWHIESLHRVSRGNPLLLEEQVRVMVVRHHLEAHKGMLLLGKFDTETLPGSVQDCVMARLESLSLEFRGLLSLAAVMGQTFDARVLETLCGQPELVRRCLVAAGQAVLVRPYEGQWEFVSEATHAVFYDSVPAAERDNLNGVLSSLNV